MDIYKLRNCIFVTIYYSHSEGGKILYIRDGKTNVIALTKAELVSELIAIGSLDDNSHVDEIADYILSQWDALNIAIRFELARDTQRELENSDIFNTIANITKPNK